MKLTQNLDPNAYEDLEKLRKKQTKTFQQKLYAWEVFDSIELPPGFPFKTEWTWSPGYFGKVEFYLGESDRSWGKGRRAPHLKMEYIGEATSELDAIQDLADFQAFFRVLLQDGIPSFSEARIQRKPDTYYRGVGQTPNGELICITLECPWPPRGCVIVEKEEIQTKYEVSCARN